MVSHDREELWYTKFELDIKLFGVVDEQEAELEQYLESLPDRFSLEVADRLRLFVEVLRRSFASLFRTSQTLVQETVPLPISWRDELPLLDMLFLNDLFQFELARDLIGELPRAAQRARQLLDFVTEAAPEPSAQRYLARVSRCFTWGYEAETLILCRSVLEQVLADVINDADVFSAFAWKPDVFPPSRREDLRKRDPFKIAIGDRIHAAQALGKITVAEVDSAKQIRDRGDKAVHEAPPSSVDVAGTVKDLTQLIGKLCSARSRK